MSGVTDNYGFILPAEGEAYDVAIPNGNNVAIDAQLKTQDTNRIKKADALVARLSFNATSVGLSGSAVMANFVVVNLVANRWYRAKYIFNTVCSGGADVAISSAIRKSATSDETATGTDVDDARTIYTPPVANQLGTLDFEAVWKASASETVNIKAVLTRLTTAHLYDISLRRLTVEDMGANLV